MTERERVTAVGRELSRRFRCPRCDAGPGEPCQGRSGPRQSTHQARHEHAVQVLNSGPRR